VCAEQSPFDFVGFVCWWILDSDRRVYLPYSSISFFQFTISNSLFPIRYFQFAISNSLLSIRYFLFTIFYSLFSIHYFLFTIFYSLSFDLITWKKGDSANERSKGVYVNILSSWSNPKHSINPPRYCHIQ